MARIEIAPTGGLGKPTLIVGNEKFHNWEVFSYDGCDWILSVNRDNEVHLVPTTEIKEATEIPKDKWVEFTPDEFEEKLGGEIVYQKEKHSLR